jgi:hypothetical protein
MKPKGLNIIVKSAMVTYALGGRNLVSDKLCLH